MQHFFKALNHARFVSSATAITHLNVCVLAWVQTRPASIW